VARAIVSNEPVTQFAKLHRLSSPEKLDSIFSDTLQHEPFEYISVYRALCTQDCEVWATQTAPLQFDSNHLTCQGSIELARKVGPQLFPGLPPANARNDACEVAVNSRGQIATNAQNGPKPEQ